MRILLRVVVFIAAVGVISLLGVAIFSDLPAPQREVELQIDAK